MTGKILGKRYELIEKIDSGGMADIYKAFCKKSGKVVAVKILKDKYSRNPDYIERFKKEAGAVFSLSHPNIVDITDIGNENGIYYIVMEFVEGATLKNIINKRIEITEKDAIKYSIQICKALCCAHSEGIIHRDIKPQNIIIDKSGTVKLTDFGIAGSLNDEKENSKQVIGSVYYISPEQARGEALDASTDIYSLGIVIYEMLTGQLPHTGKTVSVALKHINEQILPPGEIKSGLSNAINCVILKATSRDKAYRYKTIDAFKDDLINALTDPEGSFIDLPPELINIGVKALKKRKKNLLFKIGILTLVACIAAALAILAVILLNPPAQKTILVPDVLGLDINDAQSQTTAFNVTTTYIPDESAHMGTVLSQSPAPGSYAEKGADINLTISGGPDEIVMPDFSGMAIEDVKAQIITMGLTIEDSSISYEPNANIAAGKVISQSPESGSPLSTSDTIILIVSQDTAQNSMIIPDCTGMALEDAVEELFGYGFSNCYIYVDDSPQKAGTVLNQSPPGGDQAKQTDEIDLHISRYKNNKYEYEFIKTISVVNNKTTIVVVVKDNVGKYNVSFVVKEIKADAGSITLDEVITSVTGGKKTVVIYENNIEIYTAEVSFND